MYTEETCNLVALSKIRGVGALTMKILISYCGSAKDVFLSSDKALSKIPGVNRKVIALIRNADPIALYDEEMDFISKNNIQVISYLDEKYPGRLKLLIDSPALIYYKGTMDLNKMRILSVIGTRKASQHALLLTQKIIAELKPYNVAVISGLAYGIDITAHKAALNNEMDTLAVVAHGLDMVYPAVHRSILSRMLDKGGVLTEFPSGVIPHRERFPMRNRIVAGLCDALLVIESAKSGGSMITTQYANDYNRDVLAIPGRVGDPMSTGTNYLIKSNLASLVESAEDIVKMMIWDQKTSHVGIQKSMFPELDEKEQIIWDSFDDENQVSMNYLIHHLGLSSSHLAGVLLSLEFKGVLKALPGNCYAKI